jgi:diguanylate cyclase (GGDEF)-like protein
MFAQLRSTLRSLRTDDPELARAQVEAMSSQIPHLYTILSANAFMLAATHVTSAPWYLSVLAPAIQVLAGVIRILLWYRRCRTPTTAANAASYLRQTPRITAMFGAGATIWALSLYPYGDAFAKCHVAFYMAITVISCIFCLRHAPQAALLLASIVVIPFVVFFVMSGHLVLIAIAINLVMVAGSVALALIAQFADFKALIVSRRELLERQQRLQELSDENSRLANVDSLTGLPNRRHFLAALSEQLEQARAEGSRLGVAMIDLDGFKTVNDVYGHTVGDRLIAEVGQRMRQVVRSEVTIARLGGDEFGVLLAGNPSIAGLSEFGDVLCELLRGRYLTAEIATEVTGSLGIVAFPEGGQTASQLFERADAALYHAKNTDRGHAVLFSNEHELMIRDASLLEHALRHADLESELDLAFQPIVDGVSGRTIGFEALARWTSPRLGAVPPDRFIQAAERINVIGRLTVILLGKALCEAAAWPVDQRISFNLSALDLKSPLTVAAITQVIERSGFPPGRIDFEITETAVMRDLDGAVAALAALRRLGVGISLDDFGTGTSSLSQVHRLKPDKLKIDRSFVTDIPLNQTSLDIVRTTVELCRGLRLMCVVEGVETEPQVRCLRKLGCHFMQGYFFGKPMPASAIAAHLASERQTAHRPLAQAIGA